MTVDVNQSEELAKMIKVEAQKTIQMLEMFMKMNNSDTQASENHTMLQEIQNKTSEDMKDAVEQFYQYAKTSIESEHSDREDSELPELREDLFEGMDDNYPSTMNSFMTGKAQNDHRMPFSKYVESALKRTHVNRSVEKKVHHSLEGEDLRRYPLNIKSNIGRNENLVLKDNIRSIDQNKIQNRTLHYGFTPGKFFKARLKPLHNNKDRKFSIKNLNNFSETPAALVSKKHVPEGHPDYFYEYQLSVPAQDQHISQRQSTLSNKNRELIDSYTNPLQRSVAINKQVNFIYPSV